MTVHRETVTQYITFKRGGGGRGESVFWYFEVFQLTVLFCIDASMWKVTKSPKVETTYIYHLSVYFPSNYFSLIVAMQATGPTCLCTTQRATLAATRQPAAHWSGSTAIIKSVTFCLKIRRCPFPSFYTINNSVTKTVTNFSIGGSSQDILLWQNLRFNGTEKYLYVKF